MLKLNMSWFYLALLAPVLYAVVNLIDDNLVRGEGSGPYHVAIVGGFFGMLPLISRLFLHTTHIPTTVASLALLAGFLTTTYYFFYLRALELESPSIVIALFSLVPATVPILAHLLLGEQLAAVQILGLCIIILASLGLSISKTDKFVLSAALIPAGIAIILVDAISIINKYAYDRTSFYPVYMFISLGMGIGGVFFLLLALKLKANTLKSLQEVFRKYFVFFILVSLFSLGAEFVLNLAISRGSVSLVRAIEGSQPMFVLLIALALYPFWPKYFREAAEGKLIKKFLLMIVIIVGLLLINRSG